MKVDFKKAKQMLEEILMTSGADKHDIKTMLELCIEDDLHGSFFSTFAAEEARSTVKSLKSSIGKQEEVVVDKPSLKLINGNGRSAKLISAQKAVPLLIEMAKQQGIAIIGIYNSTYNGSLETLVRMIARQDLIGIVTANGGPQGVVPFGGKKDIFGTNPLAYAIPTVGLPIVFDGATAQRAYGTIRIAKEHSQKLPPDTYLTKQGEFTTDPKSAFSLIPFGGYKGSAIVLLLEVLTGMLIRAKSGLDQQGAPSEIGSLLIAIDPTAFGSLADFKRSSSKLVRDIEAVPPLDPNKPVRVPGKRGERLKQEVLSSGQIELDELDWKSFVKYYEEIVESGNK